MRVFDTVINTDFGGVEETGILLTIPDIYPEKKQRYMRWQGWRENLKQRREHFRLRLQEHLSRIGKDGKCSRAGFSRVGCLILIKLRLFGVIFLFMDAEFLEKL